MTDSLQQDERSIPRVTFGVGKTHVYYGPSGHQCLLTIYPDRLVIDTTVDGNFAGPGATISWDSLDRIRAELSGDGDDV